MRSIIFGMRAWTLLRSNNNLGQICKFTLPLTVSSLLNPAADQKNIAQNARMYSSSTAAHQIDENSNVSSKSKIAVAQMTSVGNIETNFQTCKTLAEQAVSQGAKILFLPENFNFLGISPAESLALAEPLNGPIISRYAALAKSLNIWLSLGGFQERGPDPEHLYNCQVIINAAGDVAASYRKIHLFNVDVPGGPVLMESRFTAPGTGLATCDSPVGRLGLSVCYDLRFPAVYQRLAFELGAEILLIPSAFTVATGKAHWEVLLRARAIETQTYVVAAAQAGRHNEKRESYGHSLIIDPWGRVIGKLDDPLATGIAVAEVDLEEMRSIRERMPVQEHRLAGQVAIEKDFSGKR
jgi:predicted amidohydrolase